MGRVRQGIIGKKRAIRKDKKSKYTLSTKRTIAQTNNKNTNKLETKYNYSRRITTTKSKYSYKR